MLPIFTLSFNPFPKSLSLSKRKGTLISPSFHREKGRGMSSRAGES